MILKFVFASVLILGTSGYTPSSKTYLLGLVKEFPLFNQFNLYDGPSKISNAPTMSASMTPTLEQMMYYNYYSTSMYCPYELANLTCDTCKKFKDDVTVHTGRYLEIHHSRGDLDSSAIQIKICCKF